MQHIRAVLNIGLAREGKPNLTVGEVLAALTKAHLLVCSYRVGLSNTEPTLIVRVQMDAADWHEVRALRLEDVVFGLCHDLDQDAIAGKHALGDGFLVGPLADEWGPFNPAYFLEL